MKKPKSPACTDYGEVFYGSATVGERGQVVIPAEARAALGFVAGDKVLIMRHPAHHGLMICKIEAIREVLDMFHQGLSHIESSPAAPADPEENP